MAPIAQDASPTSVTRVVRPEDAAEEDVVEVGYSTPDRKKEKAAGAAAKVAEKKATSAAERETMRTPPPGQQVRTDVLTSQESAVSTPVASGSSPDRIATAGGGGGSAMTTTPRQPDLIEEALGELDPSDPEALTSIKSGDMIEREVAYSSGPPELFLAIEQCRWDDAVKACRDRPDQAMVWVKSSGTEQTSFDWNVWRRLPIHEACRRQPPPILLSALLDAYPASVAAKTHFGELPLHLAVGCGSNPESIHLLLASYPSAASKLDDAGRSPSDLVHEGVQHEDRAVILGSLERCLSSQKRIEDDWAAKLEYETKRHAAEVDKLSRDNRKRLAVKDMALAELAREVQSGSELLNAASSEADEREREIQRRTKAERALAEQARTSEEEVSRLRAANRELKKRIGELDGTVVRHETTIERLNGRIDALSEDMRKLCTMHDELVENDVRNVEKEMVRLIRMQKSFLNVVRDRGDAIRTILAEADVEPPQPPKPRTSTPGGGALPMRSPSPSMLLTNNGNESGSDGESSQSGCEGKPSSSADGMKKSSSRSSMLQFRRKHEPPESAKKLIKKEGQTERAVESAAKHLEKEKLLGKGKGEKKGSERQ